jgi:hypothetical protein
MHPAWWRGEWRRLFASEFPDGHAEALGLVSDIVLDSGAREMHDPDRQFEHGSLRLKGAALACLVQA